MSEKTRIAIVGYGNVGKGVYGVIERTSDMELSGIITRNPERVYGRFKYFLHSGDSFPNIYPIENAKMCEADVAILCGGSATDLPVQGPQFAAIFNTVDSFDNHKEIFSKHFPRMDKAARESGHTAVISAGWDPGTFSLERVLGSSFIPGSNPRGFYGLREKGGLSMGHSDALRTEIKGIKDARQYTHAIPEAMERLKKDPSLKLTPGEMHWRECYVVLEEGADPEKVKKDIINLPGYFKGYRTEVYFISQNVLDKEHKGMSHDGVVLTPGNTASGPAIIEYKNQWHSNPEGTAGILVACARACKRMHNDGKTGAITMLDIPPKYYSSHSMEELQDMM